VAWPGVYFAGRLPVWLSVPGGAAAPAAPGRPRGGLRRVVGIRTAALLLANTAERTCFAAMAVYLATFLLTTYGVAMRALALALALVALGNLAGNLLGGWLADRVAARPLVFAVASTATGALGLPLMLWHPGVAASVLLGFAYSLANAAGRPALMATLSEVPAEVRGTVLGLNVTMSSVGWLGASAVGGWLVARHGFGGLGALTAGVSAAGAGLAVLAWRARRR
jgi:DHA1 family inner membrane transport protein